VTSNQGDLKLTVKNSNQEVMVWCLVVAQDTRSKEGRHA